DVPVPAYRIREAHRDLDPRVVLREPGWVVFVENHLPGLRGRHCRELDHRFKRHEVLRHPVALLFCDAKAEPFAIRIYRLYRKARLEIPVPTRRYGDVKKA